MINGLMTVGELISAEENRNRIASEKHIKAGHPYDAACGTDDMEHNPPQFSMPKSFSTNTRTVKHLILDNGG